MHKLQFSEGVIDIIRAIYEIYPDLNEKDHEIVSSLLWHIGNSRNVQLNISEDDIVIYPIKGN